MRTRYFIPLPGTHGLTFEILLFATAVALFVLAVILVAAYLYWRRIR